VVLKLIRLRETVSKRQEEKCSMTQPSVQNTEVPDIISFTFYQVDILQGYGHLYCFYPDDITHIQIGNNTDDFKGTGKRSRVLTLTGTASQVRMLLVTNGT
jgi:hypothetical protein